MGMSQLHPCLAADECQSLNVCASAALSARLTNCWLQALLNEIKHGPEISQLAEVTLIEAYQHRQMETKLLHALKVLLPGLRYMR